MRGLARIHALLVPSLQLARAVQVVDASNGPVDGCADSQYSWMLSGSPPVGPYTIVQNLFASCGEGQPCRCNTVMYSLINACGLCQSWKPDWCGSWCDRLHGISMVSNSLHQWSLDLGCPSYDDVANQSGLYDIAQDVVIPAWACIPLLGPYGAFDVSLAETVANEGSTSCTLSGSYLPSASTSLQATASQHETSTSLTAVLASVPPSASSSPSSSVVATTTSVTASALSPTLQASSSASTSTPETFATSGMTSGKASYSAKHNQTTSMVSSGSPPIVTQSSSSIAPAPDPIAPAPDPAVSGANDGPAWSNHEGTIVGGVFGGVFAAFLLALLMRVLLRRRLHARKQAGSQVLTSENATESWTPLGYEECRLGREASSDALSSMITSGDADDLDTLNDPEFSEKKSVTYGEYPDL
ncbi:hypothetical protein BD413DRAFT_526437 [Trametes elegans]|nr:hypothetical protein BD413DRAFT_526437 [Trametes elegans]